MSYRRGLSFLMRFSQTARWRARAKWWELEPVLGKPTHRPIWIRTRRRYTATEIRLLMEKAFFECGTQPDFIGAGVGVQSLVAEHRLRAGVYHPLGCSCVSCNSLMLGL